MDSEIVSKYISLDSAQRFLSYRELFREIYSKNKSYSLRNGLCWEHEDIIAVTESYCHKHASRLLSEGEKYIEKVVIVQGPKTILIKSIFAKVVIGSFFDVYIGINNCQSGCVTGRLSLKDYIKLDGVDESSGYLVFFNEKCEYINFLKLNNHESLILCFSGLIRVNSSIDFVLDKK